MGNLINALNGLKTNIFGGAGSTGSTTPILRQSAIEMKDNRPTSKASEDPFAFSSISYPRDVTNDLQNGHYMLFYINRQNRSRFGYTDAATGVQYGESFTTGGVVTKKTIVDGVPQLGLLLE